ncbi:dihydroorotate dehydrogenase [Actinocorallia sp. API 0066]|uniref:dihydroorotate dehydrogenase n=1 Tax=Actinocorallia sp. API 0066 TaxID=2896846 RepID=UPI001E5B326A|nr:dihydroorotate dehydrogenase [Actinocorallia sp. API 0066]MCD0450930.1 dihydroorotate dehydrogenase [Actinocorallia sp. API 0066]
MNLTTPIGAVTLANPLVTASGCGGTGRELAPYTDLSRLGAFTTATVMARPRAGRPTPRIAETPSGLLNAMGLPGPGLEAFLARELPWLAAQDVPTVVSVGGNTVQEFAEIATRLAAAPAFRVAAGGTGAVAGVEVNVACPNAEDRGRMFAAAPAAAAEVVRAVRGAIHRDIPVLAKLSPDVTDIATIALACADAGATGLSLINTVSGLAIDPATLRPALSGVSGGLSGPAVRPVALRCVFQVHAAIPDLPIVGGGGIATGSDALEFLVAGATAFSVGTTLLHDPSAPQRILRELEEALAARGVARPADAVGMAHRPASPPRIAPPPRPRIEELT